MRNLLVSLLRPLAEEIRNARPSDIHAKAALDHVTDIDLRIDRALSEALAPLEPTTPVFSEERDLLNPPKRFWMVDPLDGTANFIAGIPFVAISVALIDAGKPVLSAVADVYAGKVYSAELGNGAFVDEKRLSVPAEPTSLIGVSSGLLDQIVANAPAIWPELRKIAKFRNLGAQALQLCYVGSGQLGANGSKEAKFWDDAAGRLIATEAGAVYRASPDNPGLGASQNSWCAHPVTDKQIGKLVESAFTLSS